jgi:hypothetical protein
MPWEKEFLVPPGIKCIPLNRWSMYDASHQCMTRLYEWMSSRRCSFSTEAQRYFGTGFHSNSGGSDTLGLNIAACAYRALFCDMGIPEETISNILIARALPSREMI